MEKKNRDDESQKHPGRKSDPRMLKALELRLSSPHLSLTECLIAAGFEFTYTGDEANMKATSVFDKEGISLAQRKNNLSRRIRLEKKKRGKPREESETRKAVCSQFTELSKSEMEKRQKIYDSPQTSTFGFTPLKETEQVIPTTSFYSQAYKESGNNLRKAETIAHSIESPSTFKLFLTEKSNQRQEDNSDDDENSFLESIMELPSIQDAVVQDVVEELRKKSNSANMTI